MGEEGLKLAKKRLSVLEKPTSPLRARQPQPLPTTLTGDSAMAAAAMIGEGWMPKVG